MTFGCVCNLFNEAVALPGWLEMATSYFDDVRVIYAAPKTTIGTDRTLEILEKWGIPWQPILIDRGFGYIRTKAVRYSPCDWVAVLDVDERFRPIASILKCVGEPFIPEVADQILQTYDTPTAGACPFNWENEHNLTGDFEVESGETYNQGAWLRSIIEDKGLDAVMVIRRQWQDWHTPSQNWHTLPDHQIRIVRNDPSIYWTGKMHESLGSTIKNVYQPNQTHGPFLEHLHIPFKRMNPEQRARDIETYREIANG